MSNLIVIGFFESKNLGDKLLAKYAHRKYSKLPFDNVYFIDFTTSNICYTFDHEIVISDNYIKLNQKSKNLIYKYISLIKFIIKNKNKKKIKKINELICGDKTVIFSTGNLLMDINPVWIYLVNIYIKFLNPNKTIFEYVGVGPISLKINKNIFKNVFKKTDSISVRDYNSKTMVKRCSQLEVIETLDPILVYKIKKIIDLPEKQKRVGICFLGEICFKNSLEYHKYLSFIKQLTDYYNQNNIDYVLYSTEINDYYYIYKNFTKCVIYIKSEEDLYNLYNNLKFIIGGRMHSLIIAQTQLVPFVGVDWQNKIGDLFKLLSNKNLILEYNDTSLQTVINLTELYLDNNTYYERALKSMELVNNHNSNKFIKSNREMELNYV